MKKSFDKIKNPMAGAPVDPPAEQPSDEALLEDIRSQIASDGRLEGEEFEVQVEEGRVTLTGTVSREFLRGLIDAQVKSVPGVLVVMDQLVVREPGPMSKPPE